MAINKLEMQSCRQKELMGLFSFDLPLKRSSCLSHMLYNGTVFRLDSAIRSIYIFGEENLRKTYEQFPLFNTEGCVGIS